MGRPALAVDFGAFSSKVAWRNGSGEIGALKFGSCSTLRTAFFLPESSSEILLGDEAQEAAEDEPVRAVRDLKRCIIDHRKVWTTQDRPVEAQDLLGAAFVRIQQEVTGQLGPEFNGCDLSVCMSAAGSLRLQTLLGAAAASVGLRDAGTSRQEVGLVQFAAIAGDIDLSERQRIVTLDCGASGTRWASLDCDEGAIGQLQSNGELSVGGSDLDVALQDWLLDEEPALCAVRTEVRLLDQLRQWKEVAFDADLPPLRIKGVSTGLSRQILWRLYEETQLTRLLGPIARFLEGQRSQDTPLVVLMTGGACTSALRQAIEELGMSTRCLTFPIDACVRGILDERAVTKASEPSAETPARPPDPPRWRGQPRGAPSVLDGFGRRKADR